MSLFGNKKRLILELKNLIIEKDKRFADLAANFATLDSKYFKLLTDNKITLDLLAKEKQKNKEILEYEEKKEVRIIEDFITTELQNIVIKSESTFKIDDKDVMLKSLNDLIIALLPYIYTESTTDSNGVINIINQLTILTNKIDEEKKEAIGEVIETLKEIKNDTN